MVRTESSNFEVDISPEMQLYRIFQAQSYGIGTALAEFLDNSIQSFRDKKQEINKIDSEQAKLKIKITVNGNEKMISIEDNAGGISRDDFQRAMRMGNESNFSHSSASLSMYGIGMKTAAIWLSSTWQIETSSIGDEEKLSAVFDLDKLLAEGGSKMNVTSSSENPNSHYTKIVIKNTQRGLNEDDFKDEFLPYLQETYFKFKDEMDIELNFDNLIIEAGKKKMFLDKPQPLIYPPVDSNGEKIGKKDKRWFRNIDFNHMGKKVTGYIMIAAEGSYSQPGIRLLRNQRVIFGTKGGNRQNYPPLLLKSKNKYTAQRIYGELSLNDFRVNYQKTGFMDDMNPLYRTLHTKMRDYIRQAQDYRVGKDKGKGKRKLPIIKKRGKLNTENIQFSSKFYDLLFKLKNKKLARLYVSICKISLTEHPVLAYVGAWSLLETIANYMGKDDKGGNNSFARFFKSKLDSFEKNGKLRQTYKTPIEDIHSKGNLNKHSSKYGTMNAQELINYFEALEDFLIHCVQDILANRD